MKYADEKHGGTLKLNTRDSTRQNLRWREQAVVGNTMDYLCPDYAFENNPPFARASDVRGMYETRETKKLGLQQK